MDSENMVRVLRRVRHDYGNHLQVIMSYIDLNRPEAVRNYILAIADEMAAERMLFEEADAETAIYLFEQMLLVRNLGIILRYSSIKLASAESLRAANEPYNSLQMLVKQLRPEQMEESDPLFFLSLDQDGDKIRMLFESTAFPDPAIECLVNCY